tara:strand:+ start:2440 stop:2868 length:429 start_codon:yes stop_codon:yes gene_type:complete
MASSIKYPENQALYFIEGDKLAIITKVDSSGSSRTSSRKQWKAISEAVTDGILIHYYSEPNSVTSIKDSLDIDNSLERAVVDYVKKCLYMDKAGAGDINSMQGAIAMANQHEKKFKETVQKYGIRNKDKTGGSRIVKVPNLI